MKWEDMLRVVREERGELLRTLPEPLKKKARGIQVVCEPTPSPALRRSGVEPDTLGLFEGDSLRDDPSGAPLPPRMILFLDNLRAEASGQTARFRDEVRITLLHELGHYLGFEEPDLVERDLD
jgi:predicted Zn-dependent protease with MMP-like domain